MLGSFARCANSHTMSHDIGKDVWERMQYSFTGVSGFFLGVSLCMGIEGGKKTQHIGTYKGLYYAVANCRLPQCHLAWSRDIVRLASRSSYVSALGEFNLSWEVFVAD